MPDPFEPASPGDPFADYSQALLDAFLNGYTLKSAPGTNYTYSEVGYGMLGRMLENLRRGWSYSQMINAFAKGLGMPNTGVDSYYYSLATPYLSTGYATTPWTYLALAGAGAVRSSASDLVTFIALSMDPGDDILGQAAAALLTPIHATSAQCPRQKAAMGWTIGLCNLALQAEPIYWQVGQTGGSHAIVMFHKTKKKGVVLLANMADTYSPEKPNAAALDQAATQILQILMNNDK
jgi:CubicO group peptidase (beta-lactamase class C family)